MFVSIDLENLVFLHKHTVQVCVSNLADIEAPHVSVSVIPLDNSTCFAGLTDLELLKLYRNTTGSKSGGFYRPGLELLCFQAAKDIPITTASAFEVDIQRRAIPEDDEDRYRYVAGAMRPERVNELFPMNVLRTESNVAYETQAGLLRPKVAANHMAPAAGIAPTGRDIKQANGVARVAPPAGATPRGGQRETIWAHADTSWEAAGKPTAIPKVLDMRKSWMTELEQKGIKRTSSSSELGNWMKARILSK